MKPLERVLFRTRLLAIYFSFRLPTRQMFKHMKLSNMLFFLMLDLYVVKQLKALRYARLNLDNWKCQFRDTLTKVELPRKTDTRSDALMD